MRIWNLWEGLYPHVQQDLPTIFLTFYSPLRGFSHQVINHHSRSACLTAGPLPYPQLCKNAEIKEKSLALYSPSAAARQEQAKGSTSGAWSTGLWSHQRATTSGWAPLSPRTVSSPKTVFLLSFKQSNSRVTIWVPNDSYKPWADKNQWAGHSSCSYCAAFTKEMVVSSTILNKFQFIFRC